MVRNSHLKRWLPHGIERVTALARVVDVQLYILQGLFPFVDSCRSLESSPSPDLILNNSDFWIRLHSLSCIQWDSFSVLILKVFSRSWVMRGNDRYGLFSSRNAEHSILLSQMQRTGGEPLFEPGRKTKLWWIENQLISLWHIWDDCGALLFQRWNPVETQVKDKDKDRHLETATWTSPSGESSQWPDMRLAHSQVLLHWGLSPGTWEKSGEVNEHDDDQGI